MLRKQPGYANDYYSGDYGSLAGERYGRVYQSGGNPENNRRLRNEFDAGNADYERDMLYGRSGLERISDHDDRDYTADYRGSGVYDEDDYDSDYGESRNYEDRTFSRRNRGQSGSAYRAGDNRRPAQSASADFMRRYTSNYKDSY